MYVYLCTEKPGYLGSLGVWTVGHYNPSDNRFIGTADYGTADDAAERVAFLNGGDTSKNLRRLEGVVRQLVGRVDVIDSHITRILGLMAAEYERTHPGELEQLDKENAQLEADADPDACTNPGGHEWDKSAGEADEARIAGDVENDGIHCVHCGADGDA